jgi:NAD(P)-dependent dehydrogenase (short-subunit alcohol dehydrogenase family)
MSGALENKVAIVTGAGRGIGRGEALALAAEGAKVVVNDFEESLAKEVVDEIASRGGTAITNGSDVASWAGAEAMIRQAVEELGGLDVLVNNAGFLRDQISFKMTEENFDDVVRVHLKGHFAPARFACEYWRDRFKSGDESGGAIVNTVSEAGLYGGTGQANYVAAKAGIAGMTVGLAREMKKNNVRVNAIAPRARTRMTEELLGDFAAAKEGQFDEWNPDNVGPVVAWLASDASAGVNGQVFVVFGGRVHRMKGWDMVGEIEQDHQWSVDELRKRTDELFGEDRKGIPTMGFGR